MKKPIPENWRQHDLSIRPYLWSHRIVSYTQGLLGLILLGWGFYSHWLINLEWHVSGYVAEGFLGWLAFFGIIAGLWEAIGLPFGVANQFIEKHFKLSRQSYLSWFWDKIKGLLLGVVFGILFLGILYLSIRWCGSGWWVVACTLMVLLSVVLAQLTPVLLIPLFYKLHPMEANELKARLLVLCKKFSVEVKEVYHLGMGEKTEKGNAAFVGLGRTKRIMIGDTLYQKFSPDEVEAVFAHELGHQVHNDLWKGIILSSAILFLGFFLNQWATQQFFFPQLETDVSRPFGILVFFVVLTFVQWPFGVLQAMYSRNRERAADDFAARKIGVGAKLADALERLTIQNRGQFKPNAILEFFTYSHPAPWRRILPFR